MQLKRRHAGLMLALGAVALTPLFLHIDPGAQRTATVAPADSPRPMAIIEAPRVTLFGESGGVRHQLWGERLTSLGTGRWLEVELPRFDLGTATGDTWHLRSLRGVYDQRTAVFSMMGEVSAARTTEGIPILVSTDFMEVDLDSDQLATDAPVRLESPGHSISGTGMVADINLRRFELLHHVEAVHELP